MPFIVTYKFQSIEMWKYNFNFRGKGDNHRLGHTVEDHVRYPKQMEALSNKKVIDIAIGEFWNANSIYLRKIILLQLDNTFELK